MELITITLLTALFSLIIYKLTVLQIRIDEINAKLRQLQKRADENDRYASLLPFGGKELKYRNDLDGL